MSRTEWNCYESPSAWLSLPAKGKRCAASPPSLLHSEMPTELDPSRFPVCAFYYGTIPAGKMWHFSQLQFAIFLLSLLLRQIEWKNFLFQSPHFFALTQILVRWWKDNGFLCPHPALRTSVQIWAILSEGNPERTEKLWCNMKWSDFQRRSRPPPAALFNYCWLVHQAANLYQQQ